MTAADVERALEGRERRADRLRKRILDEMLRGTLLIDTAGATVGQVNALSVLQARRNRLRPSLASDGPRRGSGAARSSTSSGRSRWAARTTRRAS